MSQIWIRDCWRKNSGIHSIIENLPRTVPLTQEVICAKLAETALIEDIICLMDHFNHRLVDPFPARSMPSYVPHTILIPNEPCPFTACKPQQLGPIRRVHAADHVKEVEVPRSVWEEILHPLEFYNSTMSRFIQVWNMVIAIKYRYFPLFRLSSQKYAWPAPWISCQKLQQRNQFTDGIGNPTKYISKLNHGDLTIQQILS